MPRPHKRFWLIPILLAACAAAITLVALTTNSHPKPELVTVAFVGFANSSGRRLCTFSGTNGTAKSIYFQALVQIKDDAGWPISQNFPVRMEDTGRAIAGERFIFSVEPPRKGNTWRPCLFYDTALSKWEWRRRQWASFFYRHKMSAISRMIFHSQTRFVAGPEIHD